MQKWNFYTTDEIKPRGWLKRQLELQAEGLAGNLDKVWRDVRDSAWIGGDAEGWERVPYWLDGFIVLAYLLEDADRIARAKKYVDAILAAQKPDGWICPCVADERKTYDTWAVLLITKVLVVYYECSKDARIPQVLYRTLKNYYGLLENKEIELFQWGKYRWYEGFIAIHFVYERYNEPWLLKLAEMLRAQGQDYMELIWDWQRPLNVWRLETHIVNIAMALKYEAVSHTFLDENYTDKAEALYRILAAHNGTPVETFTGDECLSGLSPIQGTELCAVAELMYSYELLYACTGEEKWAQRLEIVAFNALPAAISDDMWTHQYDQMSNQIACKKFDGKPIFRTNHADAHLFGLEPNFGCCTANFGQAWPKFALAAFMHADGKIINAMPVPSQLTCDTANIVLDTDYPFENSFTYTVEAKKDFVFEIRMPDFAQKLTADGKPVTHDALSFAFAAGEKRDICIGFETMPCFVKRPHDLYTVKCGSLVFSVPIAYEKTMYEYEKDGVERKFPYCDYALNPTSAWAYAFCDAQLSVERGMVGDVPFSSQKPPVTVKTKLQEIEWGYEDGYDTVCAKVPAARKPIGEARELLLYPYGCAKLRMTELPFAEIE